MPCANAQEGSPFEACIALGAERPQTIGQVSVVADDYPLVSMGLREEGRTVVDVDVGLDGAVAGVRVAETSGSFRLDERSVELVNERWRFQPATLEGEPVACTTQVAVRWDLTNVTPLTGGTETLENAEVSEELLRLLGIQR